MTMAAVYEPSLEPLEAAELGLCKDVMKDDVYCSSHRSRGWIRCYVTIDDDGHSFRMYLEKSKRFLLSAKLDAASCCIRLSLHEDYPRYNLTDTRCGGQGHIAVLGLKSSHGSSNGYTLTSKYCARCDIILGRYSCGRGREEREVLAIVMTSSSVFKIGGGGDVDVSTCTVAIPRIDSTTGQRIVWCPRNLSLSPIVDVYDAVAARKELSLSCINKLPEWSSVENSLVLKFQGNRISSPSSKNFILFDKKSLAIGRKNSIRSDGDHDSMQSDIITKNSKTKAKAKASPKGSPQKCAPNPDPAHADNALMQFGRVTATRFVLDFRYPMAPVQALGVALASYLQPVGRAYTSPTRGKTSSAPGYYRSTLPSPLVL